MGKGDNQNNQEIIEGNKPNAIEEFVQDKQALENLAKQAYNTIKSAYDEDNSKDKGSFDFTEQDFIDSTKDEKKIHNYLRAQKIIQNIEKSKALYSDYVNENLFNQDLDNGFVRHAFMVLDTSGTEIADKKNISYLNNLATREGAGLELDKQIKNIFNFDFSKLNFKNDDELFDFCEQNNELIQTTFVLSTIISNGKHTLNPEVKELVDNNMKMIESISNTLNTVKAYASNLYITTPSNLSIEDKYRAFPGLVQNAINNRKKGIPGYPPKDMFDTANVHEYLTEDSLTNELQNSLQKDYIVGFDSLIKNGLPKDFMISYKPANNDLSQSIEFYGQCVNEYNTTKPNMGLDEWLETKNANHLFVKRSDKEINEIKGKIFDKDTVLLDKYVINDIDEKSKAIENQINNGSNFRRSLRRNEATLEYINNLYNNQDTKINNMPLTENTKNLVAYGLVKNLEAKHEERTLFWRLFHPSQYDKEIEAINNAKQTIQQLGHVRNIEELENNFNTFNSKCASDAKLKLDLDEKYSKLYPFKEDDSVDINPKGVNLDNTYTQLKKGTMVRESLESLREARVNYAKYNQLSRITANIFGYPKAVAEESKFINTFKQKLLASGMSHDMIDMTKADVSNDNFNHYLDYALPDTNNINYDMLVEANSYDKVTNPNREFDNKSTSSDYTYLEEDEDLKSEISNDNEDVEFELDLGRKSQQRDLSNLAEDSSLENPSNMVGKKQDLNKSIKDPSIEIKH